MIKDFWVSKKVPVFVCMPQLNFLSKKLGISYWDRESFGAGLHTRTFRLMLYFFSYSAAKLGENMAHYTRYYYE